MNKKDGDQVVVGGPKDQGGNGLCGLAPKAVHFLGDRGEPYTVMARTSKTDALRELRRVLR